MISAITVRFFSLCIDEENETQRVEVTEAQFLALKETPHSHIEYERHSVRENGVNQICLTVHADDCPHLVDLESFKR